MAGQLGGGRQVDRPARRTASPASREPTSSSAMPVQPESTGMPGSYSSASRPTADAFTRIGRSLLTTVTCRPSAARLRATARIRVSLSPSRKPAGSSAGVGVVELDPQRAALSPPGSARRAGRAAPGGRRAGAGPAGRSTPVRGGAASPRARVMTTTGRTTSCSAKRIGARGSASTTEVSRTNVRRCGSASSGSAPRRELANGSPLAGAPAAGCSFLDARRRQGRPQKRSYGWTREPVRPAGSAGSGTVPTAVTDVTAVTLASWPPGA